MISHHHLRVGWRYFWRQILWLVINPIFIILTLVGNGFMFLGAVLFYLVEHGNNPSVRVPLDALWFAVVTVTSVGYGDVIPHTASGRILGMILMIGGTAIFAAFTGLFASALLTPEMDEIQFEIDHLKQKFEKRKKEL